MAKILIVDDEYTIAETLAEILAFEGFETAVAANGELGLAALAASRPDLVLLDFMMPVMDELKMLKAMRAEQRFARIPVILMTAAPEHALGGPQRWEAFLRKPFEATLLLEVVRAVLAKPPPAY